MFKTVALLSIITLTGCSTNDGKSTQEPVLHYPTRPLIIDQLEDSSFADLKFSYTEGSANDSETIYQVHSTYENEDMGFELHFPAKGSGTVIFKSSGIISDNLLHLLQNLYKQKTDSNAQFVSKVTADCLSLSDLFGSLNKKDNAHYAGPNKCKLFFNANNNDDSYAELYLNIDDNQHWIQLAEKDEDYRGALIRIFKKNTDTTK